MTPYRTSVCGGVGGLDEWVSVGVGGRAGFVQELGPHPPEPPPTRTPNPTVIAEPWPSAVLRTRGTGGGNDVPVFVGMGRVSVLGSAVRSPDMIGTGGPLHGAPK